MKTTRMMTGMRKMTPQVSTDCPSDHVNWMAMWYSAKELTKTGMGMEIVALQVKCPLIGMPHGRSLILETKR